MKEIKAIIQPSKLPRIREAFSHVLQFPGMSVCRIEGCSHHEAEEVRQSVREALTDFSPKVRIEIVCPEEKVAEIVGIIGDIADTGRPGDGMVWVTPVDSFRRFSGE
ncbi:MAG: P-II family nitrogen regulator [Gammaproteobacteria bacterium]|nr:P-II family nitrogen regulator [Gammaproteobacteria bacterium]